MEIYRRSQFGWGVVIALVSGMIVMGVVLPLGAPRMVLLIPLAILALTIPLLSWMTVTVTTTFVRFTMGIGLIRKTMPISEIESAEASASPWYYGIGIHLTPEGPIYNVAGRGVVRLVLKNGKGLLVGSAEPQAVVAAIQRAKGMHMHPTSP